VLVKSETAERVIGCAIEVHRSIGPGLLESAYQACLRREFLLAGVSFEEQVPVPVQYRGAQLDCGYRLDFVVNRELVVELKCVERTLPIHKAQALTYLRLTGDFRKRCSSTSLCPSSGTVLPAWYSLRHNDENVLPLGEVPSGPSRLVCTPEA